MDIEQDMRDRLQGLQPTHLEIVNESHLHIGHAGNTGGGHFRLFIVSARFEGCSRVYRHRMVQSALCDLFKEKIHALSVRALTPSELSSVPSSFEG